MQANMTKFSAWSFKTTTQTIGLVKIEQGKGTYITDKASQFPVKTYKLFFIFTRTEHIISYRIENTILIPTGSLEKHIAHDPLSTDLITTKRVVEQAALKAEVPYLAAISFEYSSHYIGRIGVGKRLQDKGFRVFRKAREYIN